MLGEDRFSLLNINNIYNDPLIAICSPNPGIELECSKMHYPASKCHDTQMLYLGNQPDYGILASLTHSKNIKGSRDLLGCTSRAFSIQLILVPRILRSNKKRTYSMFSVLSTVKKFWQPVLFVRQLRVSDVAAGG